MITPATDSRRQGGRFCLVASDSEATPTPQDSDADSFHTALEAMEPPSAPQGMDPVAQHPQEITVANPPDAFSELTDVSSYTLQIISTQDATAARLQLDRSAPPTPRVSPPSIELIIHRNFITLRNGEWLSDEVVHCYLSLLMARDHEITRLTPGRRYSHYFKSFFYTKLMQIGHANTPNQYDYHGVRRYGTRAHNRDIFTLHRLYIPINVQASHWTCVCVDFTRATITHFDSMGSPGIQCLSNIHRYLKDEHIARRGSPLPLHWSLIPTPGNTPRQSNGFDCGVFCCAFIDLLFQNRPVTLFHGPLAPSFRHRIAWAILQGRATWL